MHTGTYFIRNQTDPVQERTVTEQTGIHGVCLPEGCCFYINTFFYLLNINPHFQCEEFD